MNEQFDKSVGCFCLAGLRLDGESAALGVPRPLLCSCRFWTAREVELSGAILDVRSVLDSARRAVERTGARDGVDPG